MNNLFRQLQNLPNSSQKLPTSNNLKALMNSSDPQSFIQNMIQNNPQAQNLIKMLQSSGLSPKQFFYQIAQQKGIDPEQFLNSLK